MSFCCLCGKEGAMARILVLDDDGIFRKTLCRALSARGHDVKPAADGHEALALASMSPFDAAIIDMMMPGMNGFEALKALKKRQPELACVILTGYGSIADAVATMKLGGYNYLTKPCGIDEIETVLGSINYNTHYEPAEAYHGIIGNSPGIKEVVRFIRRVKDTSLPVLISGESGAGKELVARALHFDGARKDGPFIAINCASLKPGLLENELFGHVKGAFTGAVDLKEGLLRAADKGTLFIDEIGDMDLSVQAMLLRFIETGSYRPLGASREQVVDVRIVAAINKDIEKEVASGRFRLDFYYRLNVCRVHLPPLRARVEDIPALAGHFLKRASSGRGRNFRFGKGALELLSRHSWPGNVRELGHLIERAAVMSAEDEITAAHLSQCMAKCMNLSAPAALSTDISTLDEAEKECIAASLASNNWNVSRSARALGIDRRTLQRKIARYGLKKGG